MMTGPTGFHPEDCFEGDVLIVGDSVGTGGDEETPSIVNISSETLLDIGMDAELSGIDLRQASERSLIGWVREIN